eukprot:CAMPEP_0206219590 /NCGR_PEP_ID=MMETSP0047_2-20121206/4396_1 /ASSEMBLY_ACC=CAM_ASM_000192 /TAXON_ID=195065 /ORGANISM="Chroomonas mesostigmatica_cf, Strain CCMP1168" /LENGTH=130 /DNA_ID=CAMNT_0053642135 /DNA_START=245 /DNA_END=637 /DNA_ORIENTATION=-
MEACELGALALLERDAIWPRRLKREECVLWDALRPIRIDLGHGCLAEVVEGLDQSVVARGLLAPIRVPVALDRQVLPIVVRVVVPLVVHDRVACDDVVRALVPQVVVRRARAHDPLVRVLPLHPRAPAAA